MSKMLIALAATFMQQAFASVGKTLPAVVAPVVITELDADPAWVGVYYGLTAAAALLGQMGCGSFIIRYGALRMSQVALVLLGGGMAAGSSGWASGFRRVGDNRRRWWRCIDPDQLAIAWSGLAAATGAAGILHQANCCAGRYPDLRFPRPRAFAPLAGAAQWW